jgi:ABC-type Na+ efflux pump permease subunit
MADFDPKMLKTLQDAIASPAPVLAKLLGGANAGIAVAALGKSLLGDAQAALADIVTSAQSPDANTKLRVTEAEQEAQLRLSQSQANASLADLSPQVAGQLIQATTDQTKVLADDTANARQMQIALHDKTNARLAYIVTGAFFLLIIILIFYGKQIADVAGGEGIKDLLFTLLGVIATGWANIIGFYFGSSSGSQQKSQTLSAALLQKPTNSGP